MDELPADLRTFLNNHPFLQLTDGKKVSEQITSCHTITRVLVQRDASSVLIYLFKPVINIKVWMS